MLDVFRHRKRFYLVFEFLAGTVLDEIEKQSGGMGEEKSRDRIYQVLRATAYCHSNYVSSVFFKLISELIFDGVLDRPS